MLVKDEADIIADTLAHLFEHVDWIYVSDNGSSDATRSIVDSFPAVTLIDDLEIGYWQSYKTTALAMCASEDGHSWVVPCDADELWYVAADPGRRIADFLAGQAPDVQMVSAELYNHVPTDLDPNKGTVFQRIGWRKRERGALPKTACRLHPSLVIHAGNHHATYDGPALRVGGLCVRHFSWRSAKQYVRKIRNGIVAYAATDLPEGTGLHWRMWQRVYEESGSTLEEIANHSLRLLGDEVLEEHFRVWFSARDPEVHDEMIYDPAPAAPWTQP